MRQISIRFNINLQFILFLRPTYRCGGDYLGCVGAKRVERYVRQGGGGADLARSVAQEQTGVKVENKGRLAEAGRVGGGVVRQGAALLVTR